jgi:hypothetical protein
MRESLRLIALTTTISLAASGCSIPFVWPHPTVYVGAGQHAEISKPTRIRVIVTNKETGKKENRIVIAQPGWIVGRMPEGK